MGTREEGREGMRRGERRGMGTREVEGREGVRRGERRRTGEKGGDRNGTS